MLDLTQKDRSLLQRLVETARGADPLPWESFVADRLGYAGWTIVHPRAPALALGDPVTLDHLARRCLITLCVQRSGVRTFQLTTRGYAIADEQPPPLAADETA
jgi:hypothetical protein